MFKKNPLLPLPKRLTLCLIIGQFVINAPTARPDESQDGQLTNALPILPQSFIVELGVDNIKSRSINLDGTFNIFGDWRLSAGYGRTNSQAEGVIVQTNSIRASVGTNPLNDWSGSLRYELLGMPNHYFFNAISLSGTYSSEYFSATLTPVFRLFMLVPQIETEEITALNGDSFGISGTLLLTYPDIPVALLSRVRFDVYNGRGDEFNRGVVQRVISAETSVFASNLTRFIVSNGLRYSHDLFSLSATYIRSGFFFDLQDANTIEGEFEYFFTPLLSSYFVFGYSESKNLSPALYGSLGFVYSW